MIRARAIELAGLSVLKWSKDEYNLLVLIMWTAFAVLIGVVASVIADIIREFTGGHAIKWRNGWEKERQKELPKSRMSPPKR